MAFSSSSSSSRYYFLSCFLLHLSIAAEPKMAFFFKNFGKDSNFKSQLSLYGDAMVANDSMSIQIASSGGSRAGKILYKKPINLFELNSGHTVSFTSYFVFSMVKGHSLAFVMLPFGLSLNVLDGGMFRERKMKFFGVEFDAVKDEKHVGIDFNSLVSIKVGNVLSNNLVISSGEKLQSWIDYEASSKRLDVRISNLGENKPVDPMLSCPIDLSTMYRDKLVTIALSSSSVNSSYKFDLYSWSFRTRTFPHWMHSNPMNPEDKMGKTREVKVAKNSACSSRILSALIFGIGCGAFGAFLVLFLWTVFGHGRPVRPEELTMQRKDSSPLGKPSKMVGL